MVVFTCNNCGDSLQKPRVEKHYQTSCRKGKSLTCVDCLKDFYGEEYVAHTRCMTEDERYAARGSERKGLAKGEAKQESWTEMVQGIMQNEQGLSTPMKRMMGIIAGYSNVPRKKAKFLNFCINCLGRNSNQTDVEHLWELIEKHKNLNFPKKEANGQQEQEVKNNGNTATNGVDKENSKRKADSNSSEIPIKKAKSKRGNEGDHTGVENGAEEAKKKKSKRESADIQENNQQAPPAEEELKFSFRDTIISIVTTRKEIPIKKLQKKVLKAYTKHHQIEEHTEKHVKKFNKHLKLIEEIEMKDDLIVLL